jgi:hypothetical protein
MNNFKKFLFFSVFFSNILLAALSENAQKNIKDNKNNILKTMEFDYNYDQKMLIIDNYIKIHDKDFKNDNKEEVKNALLGLMNSPHENKNKMENILVEGLNIPLKVNDNIILIDGISPKNMENNIRKNHCLVAILKENELYLDRLASVYTACPIPSENTGTFLLKVAEALAKQYQKNKIVLLDASEVTCSKNNVNNELSMLSIFKTGLNFYGRRGYAYEKNNSIDKDLEIGNSIRNISLDDLIEKINALSFDMLKKEQVETIKTKNIFNYIKKDFIEKINIFKTTDKSQTLGEFFTWLWDNYCDDYKDIFSLVFNSSTKITSPLYPNIEISRKMQKIL